ncbi:unnamed protein product [Lactuca saligna]|uniref:Uncharacterized protein n=1 Tax=Lactuca saligna TaxID=75948 RepID=A0AA36E840_LACSI|nr:unnamed protein product [Lactuca saligna]
MAGEIPIVSGILEKSPLCPIQSLKGGQSSIQEDHASDLTPFSQTPPSSTTTMTKTPAANIWHPATNPILQVVIAGGNGVSPSLNPAGEARWQPTKMQSSLLTHVEKWEIDEKQLVGNIVDIAKDLKPKFDEDKHHPKNQKDGGKDHQKGKRYSQSPSFAHVSTAKADAKVQEYIIRTSSI